jgi:hypothetical protein
MIVGVREPRFISCTLPLKTIANAVTFGVTPPKRREPVIQTFTTTEEMMKAVTSRRRPNWLATQGSPATEERPSRDGMQAELDAAPAAFASGQIRSIAIIHSRPDGGLGLGLHMDRGENREQWIAAAEALLEKLRTAV